MGNSLPLQHLFRVLDHLNQGLRAKPQGLSVGGGGIPFWRARDQLAYQALTGKLDSFEIKRKVIELDGGGNGENVRISKNAAALRGMLKIQKPAKFWGNPIKPPSGFNVPYSSSGPSVRLRSQLAFEKGRSQTVVFLNSAPRRPRKGDVGDQVWHIPTAIFEVGLYFWRKERRRFGKSDWQEVIVDTVGGRLIRLEPQKVGEATLLHESLRMKIDEYWSSWFPEMHMLDFEGDDASQGSFEEIW